MTIGVQGSGLRCIHRKQERWILVLSFLFSPGPQLTVRYHPHSGQLCPPQLIHSRNYITAMSMDVCGDSESQQVDNHRPFPQYLLIIPSPIYVLEFTPTHTPHPTIRHSSSLMRLTRQHSLWELSQRRTWASTSYHNQRFWVLLFLFPGTFLLCRAAIRVDLFV